MKKRLIAISMLMVLMALGLIFGCTQDVGEVDRTQHNIVNKAVFEKEAVWYYRATVIDVPFNTAYIFAGSEGPLEKIKWEIQEGYLIARRSWEYAPGVETMRNEHGQQEGTPVAVFGIKSHFDIKRQYSASTGEDTNVLMEDSADKLWWDTEYMRVDWSKDLVPAMDSNYSMFFPVATLNQISPISYYVQEHEEASPWRIEMPSRDEKEAEYISFVTKYHIPMGLDACWVNFGFTTGCGPSEITVKHSFMKVTPEHEDYEPADYPDHVFMDDDEGHTIFTKNTQDGLTACGPGEPAYAKCREFGLAKHAKFGYFRTDKPFFDRYYRFRYSNERRYINRWNIWQQVHTDINDKKQGTIPIKDREIKPIVYHLSPNFPADFKEKAYAIGAEWNRIFKKSVMEGYKARGKSVTISDIPDVFTVEDNSCTIENATKYIEAHSNMVKHLEKNNVLVAGEVTTKYLPNVCSVLEFHSKGTKDEFTWQKFGDLRYSFIAWWSTPQLVSLLGYGPSAADPETGQIISANANIYGAAMERASNTYADYIEVLLGRTRLESVLTGQYIRDELKRNTVNKISALSGTNSMDEATVKEIFKRVKGAFPSDFDFSRFDLPYEQVIKPGTFAHRPDPAMEARLKLLKGTPLEAGMVNSDMASMRLPEFYGADRTMTQQEFDAVSPVHTQSTEYLEKRKKLMDRLSRNNVYMLDHAELQIMGKALSAAEDCITQDLYMDTAYIGYACDSDLPDNREDLVKQIANEFFYSVELHEIGHTVGLRHNFSASFDALNYDDGYWDIWNETHGLSGEEKVASQIMKRRDEHMYSSIMDYDARFNEFLQGLGKYDEGAIKLGYLDILEVFEDDTMSTIRTSLGNNYSSVDSAIWMRTNENIPYILGDNNTEEGLANIKKRTHIVFDDLLSEYAHKLTCTKEGKDCSDVTTSFLQRDVPYLFCPDEYSGPPFGYPECQRWDHGATMTELTQDYISRYNNYYFWRNFRREGFIFSLLDRVDANPIRFYRPVLNIFQYGVMFAGLGMASYAQEDYLTGQEVFRDYFDSAIEGINFMAGIMQIPDYGKHRLSERMDVGLGVEYPIFYPDDFFIYAADPALDKTCEIPLGIGRPGYFEFNDDAYSPGYQYDVVGSIYEKIDVLSSLSSLRSHFYGMDMAAMQFSFNINANKVFADEMRNLYGGVILGPEGYKYFAPYMDKNTCEYKIRKVVDPQAILNDTNNSTELPENHSMVYPVVNFTNAYYAVLNSMLSMTSINDSSRNFDDYLRIVIKGSSEDFFTANDNYTAEDFVEFVDPYTGITYAALQTPDNKSIAVELIVYLNNIKSTRWQPHFDQWNTMKEAYENDPTSVNETNFSDAQRIFSETDRWFLTKFDYLNMFREFMATLAVDGFARD